MKRREFISGVVGAGYLGRHARCVARVLNDGEGWWPTSRQRWVEWSISSELWDPGLHDLLRMSSGKVCGSSRLWRVDYCAATSGPGGHPLHVWQLYWEWGEGWPGCE